MNRRCEFNLITSFAVRAFAALVLGSFCFISVASQDNVRTTAPIEWKNYRVEDPDITVEFPKFPTADGEVTACSEIQARHYFAYADHAVYRLTIYSRLRDHRLIRCTIVERFGERAFRSRLREIANGQATKGAEAKIGEVKLPVYEFTKSYAQHRIIDDVKNGKWVELSVTYRSPDGHDITRFFDSFGFQADNSAIDIQGGVSNTLGDDLSGVESKSPLTDPKTYSYHLIHKPKAKYTEAARNSNEQGTVRLKVVLLSNGGIGQVTVAKGLNYGLTEQALIAARRLVFLPKINEGKPVSVMVTVDYGFQIY